MDRPRGLCYDIKSKYETNKFNLPGPRPPLAIMIYVENVYKHFGRTKALDGLTLEVPPGRIFGLIGPNGAGKTTTIRILSGLLHPDSGSVRLNGTGLNQHIAIRRMTGALIEQPGLYGKLSLKEYLTFFARLYELNRKEAQKRIHEVTDLLELGGQTGEKLQGFSLGMKQKVALARILLHDPPILLLDEPTAGLDPLISKKMRDYLLGRNSGPKKTVLVSTHHLDEASRVCDEIAIIYKGRIVEQGSWEELRARHAGTGDVTITLGELRESFGELLEGLSGLNGLSLDFKQKQLSYTTDRVAETNPKVVAALAAAGASVISVHVGVMTLEQAYLKLIEDQGGET